MKKFKKFFFVIYPLFVAVYPILSLFQTNIEYIPFSDSIWSIVTAILVTGGLFVGFCLFLRDWEKINLILAMAWILFFSYGHVRNLIKNWTIWENLHSTAIILMPLWILFISFWVWAVLAKFKSHIQWNRFMALLGFVFCLLPAYQITKYYVRPNVDPGFLLTEVTEFKFKWTRDGAPPNIYYIILDGYGREDILLDIYQHDNSDFITALENQGFYVADHSNSNYIQTIFSLNSALNMEYLDYLQNAPGTDLNKRKFLALKTKNSSVQKILAANGYQIVIIDSGLLNTDGVDKVISINDDFTTEGSTKRPRSANAFELLLLESSALQGFLDLIILQIGLANEQEIFSSTTFKAHRERVLASFSALENFAGTPGSHFVFVHIVSPHPPFVFTADGNEVDITAAFSHLEGDLDPDKRATYIAGYRAQLTYINQKTLAAIETILQNSETPPIIIVQGDHGPGAYLQWDSAAKSNLPERLSILNAYYFPENNYQSLYPDISPINTFRVLFNTHFGGNFNLLEDRSYFSTWGSFDFLDVTP